PSGRRTGFGRGKWHLPQRHRTILTQVFREYIECARLPARGFILRQYFSNGQNRMTPPALDFHRAQKISFFADESALRVAGFHRLVPEPIAQPKPKRIKLLERRRCRLIQLAAEIWIGDLL